MLTLIVLSPEQMHGIPTHSLPSGRSTFFDGQPRSLAGAWPIFSFGILFLGRDFYHLGPAQLQTFIFVMLVFSGLANVYLVRERGPFWRSRPSKTLFLSTLGDILIVSLLAAQGILMQPIGFTIIAVLAGLVLVYALVLNVFKVAVFRRLEFYA